MQHWSTPEAIYHDYGQPPGPAWRTLQLLSEVLGGPSLPTPAPLGSTALRNVPYVLLLPLLPRPRRETEELSELRNCLERVAPDVNRGIARVLLDACNEGVADGQLTRLGHIVDASGITNRGGVALLSQNRLLDRPDAPLRHFSLDSHPLRAWHSAVQVLRAENEQLQGSGAARRRSTPLHAVTCLNATPRFHRIMTVLALAECGLIDLSAPDYSPDCALPYVSFFGFDFPRSEPGLPSERDELLAQMERLSYEHLVPWLDQLLRRLPLRIDDYATEGGHLVHSLDLPTYRNSKLAVVSETHLTDSLLRITEKTMKPLALGQPFVTIGCRQSLGVVRDFGYHCFDDLIDLSYDDHPQGRDRLLAAVRSARVFVNRYDEEPGFRERVAEESERNIDWTLRGFVHRYARRFRNPLLEFIGLARPHVPITTIEPAERGPDTESGKISHAERSAPGTRSDGNAMPSVSDMPVGGEHGEPAQEAVAATDDFQWSVSEVRGMLESALSLDHWVVVNGWSANPALVLSAGDTHVPLRPGEPHQFWFDRPDVSELLQLDRGNLTGFVALIGPFTGASHPPLAKLSDGANVVAQVTVVPAPGSTIGRAEVLLGRHAETRNLEDRFAQIGAPYMSALRKTSPPWAVTYESQESLTPTPLLSVVIPFYGNAHFIDLHAALLGALPTDSRELIEMIIVNDNPAEDLARPVATAASLYGIRAKVVDSGRNHGFAEAVMGGARYARGEVLMILNSDCFFDDAWGMLELARDLLEDPSLGLLVPLLLREDGSIDHLGMRRVRIPGRRSAFLAHIGAGLPLTAVPQERLHRCRYVTGACVAARRTDFIDRFGGFPTFALIGDFEDAALCDVVTAEGLSIAINTQVRATHFVRTSFELLHGQGVRDVISWFNAWQYEHWRIALGQAGETGTDPRASGAPA